MRKSGIRLAVFGVALAAFVISAFNSADARPLYLEAVKKKYPDNAVAAAEKCLLCHIGKPQEKKWNDYGTALGKALVEKNVKAEADIAKAVDKTDKEKSATEGKTFGDLLKDGKLPGKTEK